MTTILRKSFPLSIKAEGDDRAIEGWASTFGNTDSDNDIILPGAFAASLKERMPKMCWQHDSRHIPGIWDEARESDQGLYVKGRILGTTLGNDAYTLLKAGAIDSMSIGYSPTEYEIDVKTGTRTISKIDLWEVSLVTFPANEQARITSVKNKPDNARDLEHYLRDAGFSRSEAKKIVAEGFKAIVDQRDAEQQELNTLCKLLNQFQL